MDDIVVERQVAAPASDVWGVLIDVEGAPQVVGAITATERLDAGDRFGVGTRWRETRVVMGRESSEEMEVTAVDPGRSYTVEARSRGALYRSAVGVDPEGDHASRLWMRFGAEPEGAFSKLMAATVGRLFVGSMRKGLEQDLADIAVAAERGAPPAGQGRAR